MARVVPHLLTHHFVLLLLFQFILVHPQLATSDEITLLLHVILQLLVQHRPGL